MVENTSYSRLKSYLTCPHLYKKRYVQKDRRRVFKDYFMKGTLAHSILEELLKYELTLDAALDKVLPSWLENDCLIVDIDIDMLKDFMRSTSKILRRALPSYTGSNKIRTKDGSCPKMPTATTAFKRQFSDAGLDLPKSQLNIQAQQNNSIFDTFDFSMTAAQGYFFASNFELPEWCEEVIAVEHRFEDKDRQLLWDRSEGVKPDRELKWLGGPDLVCRANTGETVVIDHKTGSVCPDEIEVGWHQQLHLYAHLFELQTGIPVDGVGIYHLPTAKLIIEKVRRETVLETLKQLGEIQDHIDLELFPKRYPTEYGSPCVGSYGSMKEGDCCEYIKDCWPEFWYEHHKEVNIDTSQSNGGNQSNGVRQSTAPGTLQEAVFSIGQYY